LHHRGNGTGFKTEFRQAGAVIRSKQGVLSHRKMQKLTIGVKRTGKTFFTRGATLHFVTALKGIKIRYLDMLKGDVIAMRSVFPALIFHRL